MVEYGVAREMMFQDRYLRALETTHSAENET